MGLEKFLMSFGFAKDSLIVAIVCLLVLLGNFTGGLMSNILLAQGGPIPDRKLTQKTSFRLALVSELMLLIYAVYYHAAVTQSINTAQIIYWGFTLMAAPLLAALGAQLSYVAFAKKIDKLKAAHRNKERAERNNKNGK
ncbi:MAG: hypothetical protein ACREB6_12100 [Rhodospirillales bacterium]